MEDHVDPLVWHGSIAEAYRHDPKTHAATHAAGAADALSHDALAGVVANEHLDWTVDQDPTDIADVNIAKTAITQYSYTYAELGLGAGYTDEDAQDAVGLILVDSGSINFTYTDDPAEITAVVIAGGVDHNSLLNYAADQHVAHSGVSILAGGILSGGGTIDANRTISLAHGDVDHDQALNYLPDEHVAHSTVSISAGGILSGGGTIAVSRTISLAHGDVDHDKTLNFDPNEHLYWTQDQGATNILTANLVTTSDAATTPDVLLKTNVSGELTLDKLYVEGTLRTVLVRPKTNNAYDLGTASYLYRKLWVSEIDTLRWTENSVQVTGGFWMVPHSSGTIIADAAAGDTVISFDQGMTPGDIVLFRGNGNTEYIEIVAYDSMPNNYSVTRDLDGSGADAWPSGHPYVNLGQSGDGRIEVDAQTGGPRISVITQGATWDSGTEMVRMGDLNGWGPYSTLTYGVGLGDYAGGNYLRWDPTNGLILSGEVTAGSGEIGGWTITSTRIHNGGNIGMDSANTMIWAGVSTFSDDGFQVVYDATNGAELYVGTGGYAGNFFAFTDGVVRWKGANAELDASGNLIVASGEIGGWTIGISQLTSSSITLDSGSDMISVGGTALGTEGVQLGLSTYPQFYAGDGGSNYTKWDGTHFTFSGPMASLTGTQLRLGQDTEEHILINSMMIGFRVGGTQYGTLWIDQWTLGDTNSTYVTIEPTEVTFYDVNGYDVARYAETVRLGYSATDPYIVLDYTGLNVYDSSGTQRAFYGDTIWVGESSTGARLYYNSTSGISLYDSNNTQIIRFGLQSYIAGVLTIGSSGELRQGTGTLGTDFTGTRIWNDGGIGRIAGYNSDTQQWGVGTDGKLYAGGDKAWIDHDGFALTEGTQSADAIRWYLAGGSTRFVSMWGAQNSGGGYNNFNIRVDGTSGLSADLNLTACGNDGQYALTGIALKGAHETGFIQFTAASSTAGAIHGFYADFVVPFGIKPGPGSGEPRAALDVVGTYDRAGYEDFTSYSQYHGGGFDGLSDNIGTELGAGGYYSSSYGFGGLAGILAIGGSGASNYAAGGVGVHAKGGDGASYGSGGAGLYAEPGSNGSSMGSHIVSGWEPPAIYAAGRVFATGSVGIGDIDWVTDSAQVPEGAGLHVKTATNGGAISANIIAKFESTNDHCNVVIMSGGTSLVPSLQLQNASNGDEWIISSRFDYDSNPSDVLRFYWHAGNYFNPLTLHKGTTDYAAVTIKTPSADDAYALIACSDDIAHGLDNSFRPYHDNFYFSIRRLSADHGGAYVSGATEDGYGIGMYVDAHVEDGAHVDGAISLAAQGAMKFRAQKSDGAGGIAPIGGSKNAFCFSNETQNTMILRTGHAVLLNSTLTQDRWDEYDDVALIETARHALAPDIALRERTREFLQEHRRVLEDTGVFFFNEEDGSTFFSVQHWTYLLADGIRQIASRVESLELENKQLRQALLDMGASPKMIGA
jgi:hypothetical protein